MPFGKYQGKTLPEIMVRDLDWFFWVVPKLYGKLADEAEELRGRRGPSRFQTASEAFGSRISVRNGSQVLRLCGSLTPTMLSILDGRQDFHISICRGLFAERSTTSERAAS